MFISMFDMQYWKSNNICNAWKIKERLKILLCFNIAELLHFFLEISLPRPPASPADLFLKLLTSPPILEGDEGAYHVKICTTL